MRVRCLGLLLVCLAGCGTFGPKTPASDPRAKTSLDANIPTPPAPLPTGGPAVPAGTPGILAGQVLDSWNRKPPATYIQVTPEQSGNEPKAAPIEVAVDAQGYFLIQGLHPGKHYRLIARAKDGEVLLAGSTWATPPNPRVVIRISQDLATGNTPPMPAAPAMPRPAAPANVSAPAWPPKLDPGKPMERPAGLGAPANGDDHSPHHPENTAAAPSARRDPPTASIAGPRNDWTAGPGAGAAPSVPTGVLPNSEPPPIPYCSLTGRQLNNFALHDLQGQPWEWKQRHNKLTLVDFWGSWCFACIHAIPHLNTLQERYGRYGLDVVGLAYERGSPEQQIESVRRVMQKQPVNYTVLLGGDQLTCPVRSQFRVAAWPSLFLIDETGRIIWQDQGLDQNKAAQLERVIRQKLGMR